MIYLIILPTSFACELANALFYLDPPFRPASFAFSLPGSKDPLDACPPLDAISFCELLARRRVPRESLTHLLISIH